MYSIPAPLIISPTLPQTVLPNALQVLDGLTGLAVRREYDSFSHVFGRVEVRNKYKISALPFGTEHQNWTSKTFNDLPELFSANEETSSCCPHAPISHPPSRIGLFPPDTVPPPVWTMDRPPLLSISRPNGKCLRLGPQTFMVIEGAQTKIGRVEEDFRFSDACFNCTFWVKAYDVEDRHTHSFKTSYCGENCCAPGLFNRTFDIHITDPIDEKRSIGALRKVFPRLDMRCLLMDDTENYLILFPEAATKEEKALIVGAFFLHDYLHFQLKALDDQDNTNQTTGECKQHGIGERKRIQPNPHQQFQRPQLMTNRFIWDERDRFGDRNRGDKFGDRNRRDGFNDRNKRDRFGDQNKTDRFCDGDGGIDED